MADFDEKRSPFALRVNPLPEGKALVFFALLYALGALIWANLRLSAGAELDEHGTLIAAFLLPLALVVFQMLRRLLRAPWFAIVLIAALAATSAVASVALSPEAAVALVYRTFPFAALGLALAGSLAACILGRPLTRRGLGSILLHGGLLLVLFGAFGSLFFRVNGYMALRQGESASEARLRDFRLSLVDATGRKATLSVPCRGADRDMGNIYRARMGRVSLQMVYETGAGGSLLRVFAQEGAQSDSAEVYYGGAPGVLELAESRYMVRFGPGVIRLPFEIGLEESGVEFYPASRLPRQYRAAITLSDLSGGGKRNATLRVNHPVRAGGYDILLNSVDEAGALLEVSRDPGAPVLFAGGAIAVMGFCWGLARRLRKASGHEAA